MDFLIEVTDGEGQWAPGRDELTALPGSYMYAYEETGVYRSGTQEIEYYAAIEDGKPVIKRREFWQPPPAWWFETGRNHREAPELGLDWAGAPAWEREYCEQVPVISFSTLEEMATWCRERDAEVNFEQTKEGGRLFDGTALVRL